MLSFGVRQTAMRLAAAKATSPAITAHITRQSEAARFIRGRRRRMAAIPTPQPARTSQGVCTPRYMRESPTKKMRTGAAMRRSLPQKLSAVAPQVEVTMMVCPLGKEKSLAAFLALPTG